MSRSREFMKAQRIKEMWEELARRKELVEQAKTMHNSDKALRMARSLLYSAAQKLRQELYGHDAWRYPLKRDRSKTCKDMARRFSKYRWFLRFGRNPNKESEF